MALVTVRFYALLRLRLSTDSLHVEATGVKEVIEQISLHKILLDISPPSRGQVCELCG